MTTKAVLLSNNKELAADANASKAASLRSVVKINKLEAELAHMKNRNENLAIQLTNAKQLLEYQTDICRMHEAYHVTINLLAKR